jgi:hypothetical protein
MAGSLPKYSKPPVIETVLGVQFEPLAKFRTAHAGCFWKSYLDNDWTKIEQVPRLDDHFERFGDERKWGPMGGGNLAILKRHRADENADYSRR